MVEKLTLSVEEAAELLGVCTKTVYTMTHRADFPVIRIGRRTRISYEGLREWIRKNTNNTSEVRA